MQNIPGLCYCFSADVYIRLGPAYLQQGQGFSCPWAIQFNLLYDVCVLFVCRQDFLKGGTMAKGAAETGKVESYMCAKIRRNPLVQRSCAEYRGYFVADEAVGNISKGTQWLVWRFESDSTLADALDGAFGRFPECLERLLFKNVNEDTPQDKREVAVRVHYDQWWVLLR